MFRGGQGRTRQDERDDEIYAKAGRRMLDGGSGWWNHWQLEFQKSIDRHSAAMERLAAALELSVKSDKISERK